jgi:hypothetical protein
MMLLVCIVCSVEWQDDRRIGKDLEGSNAVLIAVLSRHFPEGPRKTTKKNINYEGESVNRPQMEVKQL